jgi:hypothetical protein
MNNKVIKKNVDKLGEKELNKRRIKIKESKKKEFLFYLIKWSN